MAGFARLTTCRSSRRRNARSSLPSMSIPPAPITGWRGAEQLAAGDIEPADYLVDGGFAKNEDIEWAHQRGTRLWCPAMHNKHGTQPYAPRPEDTPGVADWRQRMASAR